MTAHGNAVTVPLRIVGGFIALLGLALTAGGLRLLTMGGAPTDLLIGLVLVTAGNLLMWRRISGAWLYVLLTVLACAWAVAEVGVDGWPLLPRTGLFLFLLVIVGLLWPASSRWVGRGVAVAGIAGLVGLGFLLMDEKHVITAANSTSAPRIAVWERSDDWRDYGRTPAATRFAPGGQITPANVNTLELAWTYRTGDKPAKVGLRYSEGTPLKIGRTLYLCNDYSDVMAIDAATGQERWRYNAGVDTEKTVFAACRGVSYHKSPTATGACAARIIEGTVDFRLIALDAETGEPCADFGKDGQVQMGEGFGTLAPNFAIATSPPTIVGDVAVIGHMIMDNQRNDSPSGVVRGYDVNTGAVRWAWDTGKPGNTAPLKPGETYTVNTPNAWTVFAADEKLGLVYVPTGNAPPDYFGGTRRPEDEKYSSSIVALDATSGQVRWSFQATHHDIWDYDIGTQPTLVDLPMGEDIVPAVIQGTKTGQLFVLDRRDGSPITGVEERAAPTGAIDGDFTSPTQPYSVGMPDFGGPDLRPQDTWGITPIDRLICSLQYHAATYKGRYTPMTLNPTIVYPGYTGGIDWGGVSVDTDRNILIVNSVRMANYNRLVTREYVDRSGAKPMGDPGVVMPAVSPSPQTGTPYGAIAAPWRSALGLPCQAPPWGVLAGIDLKTRKIIWSRPFGTTYDNGPMGIRSRLPLPVGVPNQGGSVVTAGGLTFIAATLDAYLRAYKTETGEEVWRVRLPAGGQATPMSYMLDGRQYVVIFAGGHALMGTPQGDHVLAYALPPS